MSLGLVKMRLIFSKGIFSCGMQENAVRPCWGSLTCPMIMLLLLARLTQFVYDLHLALNRLCYVIILEQVCSPSIFLSILGGTF